MAGGRRKLLRALKRGWQASGQVRRFLHSGRQLPKGSTTALPTDTGKASVVISGDPKFDAYKESYRREIERSIGFIGRDIDFFAEAKAQHLIALIEESLGEPRNFRALDVGCGIGLAHRFLAGRLASLHGIDISSQLVFAAAAANPSVRYSSYAGGTLPFADATFDVVFTVNVVHHVDQAQRSKFVSEMARVTRSKGLVIMFEHNPMNPLTRIAVSRCSFDDQCELVTSRSAVRLFRPTEFGPPRTRYILFLPWRSHFSNSVERLLHRLPLGAQYAVAATRK